MIFKTAISRDKSRRDNTLINMLFGLAFLLLTVSMQAQPISKTISDPGLSGTVLSLETGEPLPGATLSIQGVASAITDDTGHFSLKAGDAGDVMQVRMEGYAYKEVVIRKNAGEMIIRLHDQNFNTIYREITAPFEQRKWTNNGASVATISNKENYKKAIVSMESMLQDEGLGVNAVTRSGMFGAGSNMFLRGFNTIYATSQPLIVVDGMPFENTMNVSSRISGNFITPLTGIDAKDIERITVLKDAASIYGSKAANGAILIETARATEQATYIDVHAYTGINQTPTYYPMMNDFQYRSYLTEMLSSSGMSALEIQDLPYINRDVPWRERWGVEGNVDYYRYNHNTDWQKEVFRRSMNQNYYLNIKGGDDIALYAMSVGYLNHGGIVKNTDFSRYNTQFNAELYIVKWLKMTGNMNFAYSFRNLANEGLSSFNPLLTAMQKSPFEAPFLFNVDGIQTSILEQADVFGVSNPTALVTMRTPLENKSYRFFGNLGATAELSDYFALDMRFGVTFDKMRENIFMPFEGLIHESLSSSDVERQMQSEVARYLQYYFDMNLGYRRSFDRKHHLSAFLGVRYQTNAMHGNWIDAYNSSSDDLRTVGYGVLELASVTSIMGEWKWMSYYLNGEYNYRNKYFVSYNMAVDGSSRFGKEADGLKLGGNVFGFFPSVTAAWLLSSEDFVNLPDFVEFLKIRAGYSIAGNDGIGNYNTQALYTTQKLLTKFSGLVRGNIANPNLKWETVNKVNIGIDAALFNERLIVTLDLFNNVTKDLMIWKHAKDYVGITSYVENDGTMKNTGFEIGVNGRIFNGDLKWDLGVNIAKYKNEITELSENFVTDVAGAKILTRKGNPLGLFYGYKTDGVYATTEEANAAGLNIGRADGTKMPFAAGDVRFLKQTAGDLLDESDMTVIGDPNPDWYGSIVNRLQWKRFTLNTVFTYSIGNDVYNAVRAKFESITGYDNQTINVANRWMKEGHVTNTPKAVWGDPMGNSRFSDRWIEDGSYLRWKSLTISYDIPLKVSTVRGLQVYATGLNLITFTKYLGYDPEFSAMQSPLYYGIDMGMSPQPRSLIVGVKLGL